MRLLVSVGEIWVIEGMLWISSRGVDGMGFFC